MLSQHHSATALLAIRAPREELCLDFANTLCWRGSSEPVEALSGLPDLLAWLAKTNSCVLPALRVAMTWPQRHPKRAARLFEQAVALREAVFRCASAVASGDEVATADFSALNRALAEAPPRQWLVRNAAGFAWGTADAAPSAAVLLAPVLWSAADLLAHDRLRVRRCANDACLWLFIDRSKTGSRRWCDMAACGNRAKAQRHYRRMRAGSDSR